MTIYVFAGPSLPRSDRDKIASRAVVLPPVAAGDLIKLNAEPGDVVVIIDGFFRLRPAVRHKEILDLLASGVQVHGGVSMGALRAAELASFGMVGHGRIFADYRNGLITADDEVALLHGTEEEDYESYTEALVNVRYALASAQDCGLLSTSVTRAILDAAARVPFTDRTRAEIIRCAALAGTGSQDLEVLTHILSHAPDAKRQDALEMMDCLFSGEFNSSLPEKQSWKLHETLHLRQWRAAVQGTNDPRVGAISDEQVHHMAQVLAIDYAAFRERVAIRYLASMQRGGNSPTAQPTTNAIGSATHAPSGSDDTFSLSQALLALERLRTLGILSPGIDSDPGLDRWCTATELDQPEKERTLKAAARALFPHAALVWHNPFLEELKSTGSYGKIRECLIGCLQFNYSLRAQYPTLHLTQLKAENVVAHFAQRWGAAILIMLFWSGVSPLLMIF
nr:TfuA-like protein [Streptomyces chartreusis]